jgi:tetratricopeptide (TPR) repeat protein
VPIDRGSVLHSAQLFASRGQFDAAINEWKKLSTEWPGDGSIFNSIGELHLKRQATNDAVAAFLQAANAFRAEGATLKAIATFKKILKLDASRYEVYRHLGDLNAERGLLSSAVQDYLTLGKHYIKAGKSKEALDIYKKIVSQDPSNLDAQQRVAELCLQENRQDEATTVYLQLGRERSAHQRYAEAKDAYQAVLKIDPANSEALQFIEHFKKTGGTSSPATKQGSAKSAAGSAGDSPKSAEPRNLLSEAARRIEEKQFAGAEAILNQMLTAEPGNLEVCQLLAKLHLQRGDLQVALGEYRYLAGAALRAQHYEQAESLIVEFLTVEPHSVPLLELYGELYEEKGDPTNAVRQYENAIVLLLKHPEPGMPTLHEELFEKVTALAPDSPTVKKLTALIHSTAAEEPLVPAQSTVSASPAVVNSSGSTQTNTFSTANVDSDNPLSVAAPNPPSADRHVSHSKSKPAPAESELPQATEPDHAASDSGCVWTNAEPDEQWEKLPQAVGADASLSLDEQFQTYMKVGQRAEAEAWLSGLVTAQPDHAAARELFGSLLEAKGDTAGAALQYSRALELLLAHPQGESQTQQAGLYAKVKELAPASPLVAKWAATFSPKSQASASAVERSASASSGNKIDSETHYTLGVAYKNMGLLDEAKEEFSLSMQSCEFFSDSCLMIAVCLKEQGECQSASAQLELLLKDPKCQGAKAQAIRYELGLLYEAQEQWSQAAAMYKSIPTFHDVPQRLESVLARRVPSEPISAFRFAN